MRDLYEPQGRMEVAIPPGPMVLQDCRPPVSNLVLCKGFRVRTVISLTQVPGFPAPFGPRNPVTCPGLTVNES
jgi:hypothetical protein